MNNEVSKDGRLICSCGAYQTSVAYSSYYAGIMFGCEKNASGCRSQDEGLYPTGDDVARKQGFDAAKWLASRYSIELRESGSMDPPNET